MKNRTVQILTGTLILTGILFPGVCYPQSQKAVAKKYLKELPHIVISNDGSLQKYRMTAVYTNLDIYGNFTGKTKVTGYYIRGFKNDSVTWENVSISNSNNRDEPFPAGVRQEYMENIKYVPTAKMVQPEAFKNFPSNPGNIFARNLIWDMLSFEIFGWNYFDSLKLNQPYTIPMINGEFDMAEIGKYSHNKIVLTWEGITEFNGEMCAVVGFNALDNKVEVNIDMVKTKGTEQYWGTILISMNTKSIEHGVMYSGSIQEIEVKGMKDKFNVKTIRELVVEKI